MSETPGPEAAPDAGAEAVPDTGPDEPAGAPRPPVQVGIRRSPRFGRFVLTGVAIGALLALGLAALQLTWRPAAAPALVSTRAVLGYFAVLGAMAGGILGVAAALLADRRSRRHVHRPG